MTTSSGHNEELKFRWDPDVVVVEPKRSVGTEVECRPLEEYFDFLESMAPAGKDTVEKRPAGDVPFRL